MAHCRNIYEAIRINDINCLYDWIARGAVNSANYDYGTPLIYAIQENKPEFVKIILESGGRGMGDIALISAIKTHDDDIQILKLLHEYGYHKFNKYDNPVHDAVYYNRNNKLRFLLNNFSVNVEDYGGSHRHTNLYWAIRKNNIDSVLLLLTFGANPNIIGDYYDSQRKMPVTEPLLNYAKREHPEMYQVIMDYLIEPIKEPVENGY